MPEIVDLIGYVASFIILVSLLMSSVKKLRLINLIGAIIFGVYGFMIVSYPTAVMNLGIAVIDIYYLVKMHQEKDHFKMVPIEKNSNLLIDFLDQYKLDMAKYMDMNFDLKDDNIKIYFVTRNAMPAGLFIAKPNGNKLNILIDYTIPMYRDYKIGAYLYHESSSVCTSDDIVYLSSKPGNAKHKAYLEKMGFIAIEKSEGIMMEKTLKK